MTTATDDSARLGRVEGRLDEQSATLQELRDGQRELNARLDAGLQEVRNEIRDTNARLDAGLQEVRNEIRDTNARLDAGLQEVRNEIKDTNARLDAGLQEIRKEIQEIRAGQRQMFLAMLTIGGTLVVGLMAVIVALISSGGA